MRNKRDPRDKIRPLSIVRTVELLALRNNSALAIAAHPVVSQMSTLANLWSLEKVDPLHGPCVLCCSVYDCCEMGGGF